MIQLKGTGITPYTAFGKLYVYEKAQATITNDTVADPEQEITRYKTAQQEALTQLAGLYDRALADVGQDEAMIFDMHQLMLQDEDYNDSVTGLIASEQVNAAYAVEQTKQTFAGMFAAMDDEYMKGRAADVIDISERVINILNGGGAGLSLSEPVILVAEDLTPSETILLDKEKVLAFVTTGGSKSSHTAILAKILGIPAIVGIEHPAMSHHGAQAIVDGEAGELIVNPTAELTATLQQKHQAQQDRLAKLQALRGQENITLDGRTIDIYANIGDVSDVEAVLANDAGGIGLFRSEFLYLQTTDYPTEEQQFDAYRAVLEQMGGKRVIIRTLDIGADKQIGYFDLPAEENPALGMRAIRICLTRPTIFKTQLRALLRASVYGKLAIMFPMIISVEEVLEIKAIVAEARAELTAEGIAFADDIELGIMIETPAAVMISDLLAEHVDFFSVGTNDLTGYTLAIDRQNLSLERFDNPHHTGLLRMLKMAADNAHAKGKWIGICGELGADLALTEFFMDIGIDELSVSAPYVLAVREKVRSINNPGEALKKLLG